MRITRGLKIDEDLPPLCDPLAVLQRYGIESRTEGGRYEQLTRATEWQIEDVRLYGRMMKTGTQGEYPILTFSATRNDFVIGPPSEAYIKMIVAGLEETSPLHAEVCDPRISGQLRRNTG